MQTYPAMLITNTERLILRRFDLSDAGALYQVFGDDEVMRYGDGVQTREWVRERLRRCIEEDYPKWGFGPWAVVRRDRDVVMGYCGLTCERQRCRPGETELGYRLARAHWGRGYATEAARAVCDYALSVLKLPRVIALIDPRNVASIRVAEKIGMRYEREVMLEGYSHPDRVYAIERG